VEAGALLYPLLSSRRERGEDWEETLLFPSFHTAKRGGGRGERGSPLARQEVGIEKGRNCSHPLSAKRNRKGKKERGRPIFLSEAKGKGRKKKGLLGGGQGGRYREKEGE